MPKPASPAVSDVSTGSQESSSVSETYNWLIDAGVPFTAFDPVAIYSSSSSDLHDCAEEITSLFSHSASTPKMSPSYVPSGLVSPGSSFGINQEDFSLELPADMLGELNAAIWGL